MAKTIGLVGGSFDPITLGHAYLIREAARLVDELHVVLGVNSAKRYYFTDEERQDLVTGVLADLALDAPTQVHLSTNSFLIDVATDIGVTHLIRGIRNPQDFTYETEMAQVNRDFNPAISTVYVFAPPELCKVSSSTVRGMVGFKHWEERVAGFVHPRVLEALAAKHAERGGQ